MAKAKLRSQAWFGPTGWEGFVHRAWMKAEGFSDAVFDGRPVIGICNTWSELNNCNSHLRTVAEAVKRGVLQAGGLPLEFPTISLGEVLMKPTTMLFRNLMAMDVEEMIRANPLDGVVLLCGCDKTTPASSWAPPAPTCPRSWSRAGRCSRQWRDQELGSGTDVWKYWDDAAAPAASPKRSGARSRAASRAAPATAWSWAPPARWPAWPRRSA